MVGKKGDTLHVPKPLRGEAAQKVENQNVTIQANVEPEMQLLVDRHFEYSRFIEDFAAVQALPSQRRFYTDDAGYQLAKQVDTDLLLQAAYADRSGDHTAPASIQRGSDVTPAVWAASDACFMYDNSASPKLTNFSENTLVEADRAALVTDFDQIFRDLIQKLDDSDVPMDQRCMVIPPVLRNVIMGVERYISSDFRDDRVVRSGLIGSIYGIDIYVSTNCPEIESVAENGASSGLKSLAAVLFHKDAFILAEQKRVRSQTQYKQESLATLYTSDCIYGLQNYRPEGAVTLAVPVAG